MPQKCKVALKKTNYLFALISNGYPAIKGIKIMYIYTKYLHKHIYVYIRVKNVLKSVLEMYSCCCEKNLYQY